MTLETTVKPSSVIVLTIAVGNLPKPKAEELMKRYTDEVKRLFPVNELLVFPSAGCESSIQVLHKPEIS